MFIKVERPCGIPDPQLWEQNCKVPTFRTLNVIGFKVRLLSEIINKNEAGQLLNPARAQGIDWQNVYALQRSYLNEGFDTTKVPPIVLTDGTAIDGNNRIEAHREIEQQNVLTLQAEIKEGFTLDDVYDEVGLGMNNHLSSKAMSMKDCEKRLQLFFKRLGEESVEKGIEWFSTFNHPFDEDYVKQTVEKVIANKRVVDTMSPFKAQSAVKWLAKNGHETDVTILNYTKEKKSKLTYSLRVLHDVLTNFQETGEVRPIVGFLSKYDAEDAITARREAEKELKILNLAINEVLVKAKEAHKNGETFELLRLENWIPQVTGVESDLVPPA